MPRWRRLFLTSKVRLHCDKWSPPLSRRAVQLLFLTSKVRLHCDALTSRRNDGVARPFPDLKGQAPLRPYLHECYCDMPATFPDLKGQAPLRPQTVASPLWHHRPFPDLKGQAPLRHGVSLFVDQGGELFLTSKVRLHCDVDLVLDLRQHVQLFLTSKVRLHCDIWMLLIW